jgi:nucleoside-diphosphate-sugar epimerase
VSGTASVIDTSNGLGQATTRVWDDIVDLQEISTFDHAKIHAITDQLVLQEGKEKGVRTALVLPAGVYGTGKGPIKTSSMGIPWLVEGIRTRGKAFKLGAGQSISSTIHIEDLISALILLTEQALEPQGGSADWGEKGVYFVEGGSYVFVDLATALAKEMHKRGIISTAEVDEISEEDITAIHPWGALIWGSNMRARASRLRSLGWKPEQLSAIDAVEEHLL